jgi:hypothetical protein
MASAFRGHELRAERVHRQLTAVETLRRGRPLAVGTVPSRVRRLCRGWAAAATLGHSSSVRITSLRRGPRRTRPATRRRCHEEDGVRGGRVTRSTCEAARQRNTAPGSQRTGGPRRRSVVVVVETVLAQLRLRRRPRRPAAPMASAARPVPPGTAEAAGVVMPVFVCDSYAQREIKSTASEMRVTSIQP